MKLTPLTLGLISALILGINACNQNSDDGPAIDVQAPPTDAPVPVPVIFPSLSDWRVNEGAAVTKVDTMVDGISGDIYKVNVGPSAQILGFNDKLPIKAGDTVSVTFMAWADNNETEGRFRIARFCSADNNEQEVITRNLSTTPGKITFSHTFEYDHACARFQIDARAANTVLYVSNIEASKN
jgi:hypothetical protein